MEKIENSISIARDNHARAKTRQATYANRHRREEPDYREGDYVYLNTQNLRLKIKRKGRSAKFYPRAIGPFKITKAQPETSTYTLKLPPEYKIHPTFHANLLKPAFDNDSELFPDREPERPPPAFEDTEEFEIERIKDHRDVGR